MLQQVSSDCKENDLLKRNTKKNWPHQKQKFIDNKSDFLACLMITYHQALLVFLIEKKHHGRLV